MPPSFHWDKLAEIAIYQQHENNPNDLGYRKFLDRMKQPMLQQLALLNKPKDKIKGLDFGCGPGPTLSLMFEEAGICCTNYDLYFANHPTKLQEQYDFIVSTEVFEHLAQPAAVISQLVSCLKPQGVLGIMTQRPTSLVAFQTWRYLVDPTHISFFSEVCFNWLAKHWQLEQVYLSKDVILLRRIAN
ncbi:2-polyprenyl-3-methyl-5-hydroxy-6-metoxy-1,4-benzoquinol methylase [Marinospirillum insulare]|uniref:2-polyprenyl-3-methyl-5-hydroxy-6-metoxy-1, 4-benzoquinol methylase n=2 Tax=Marinospirillum insulare TaxID=217169 RepID=A0ABQ5ZZ46_9GAMM|nr:2-polyprenyl-3-methyl-5-hydroxy-6-metoxy-1,4-benzoquinol methylase [Marinospirillum insulare]